MPVKFEVIEKIQRKQGFEVRLQQVPNSENPTEQERALCNGVIVLSNMTDAAASEYIPGHSYLLTEEL